MSQEESAESRQPSKPPNHDEKLIVKPASTADPLGWIKKTSPTLHPLSANHAPLCLYG